MRDKEAQKKYLKERVKGASQRKAAKRAGVSRATALRAEKDPVIKTAMAKALDKAGATEDKIAEVVCRNLDAQKVISANIINKSGDGMAAAHSQTKDFIEVPDCMAQLKAAELAGKFRQDFIEKEESDVKKIRVEFVFGDK
jgi:DNA-binding XRE family transcriptional regulator